MKKLSFFFLCLLLAHQSSHAQWTPVSPALTSTVRGLYFTSVDTGYAVGYNLTVGQVSKTVDGGMTWNTTSITGTYLLRGITFVNKDTGFACGVIGNGLFPTTKGVIVKTEDAGLSWNIILIDTPQYLRPVNFISADIGFVGGSAGTILKTTDGGTTWNTVVLGVTSDIIQLDMADANIGYAVSAKSTFDSGRVFKTIDGGASWAQVYFSAPVGFLGLAVADANTVYAGGQNQTIVKTTDGGVSWDTVHTGIAGSSIRCGFAISASNIFMADDGTGNAGLGSVLHTADAGLTWTDTTLTSGFFSINFPTPTTGYLGNLAGSVFKYSCVPIAAATAIIGLDSVCSGSTEQYSVDSVAGADSYYWSVPADAVINSGQGTTEISVTYGVISGDVSVTSVSNSCGDGGSISKSIVVSPSPSPTITFSDTILSSSDAVGNQWYFDGSPIGGATDSTYVPTENGNYYTIVTNSYGCTGASNSIDVIGLGINHTSGSSLAIFPNPSEDVCMIYFPKIAGGKLRIVNAAGAIEFSENNLTGEIYKLNTASLAGGFYLVRLYDRENHLIATSKLIVQ